MTAASVSDVRVMVIMWGVLQLVTLGFTLRAQRAMPRRAAIALMLTFVPSLCFAIEYLPKIALAWGHRRIPAPYDCVVFFPSLFGVLLGPLLLSFALVAIYRAHARRSTYAAAALSGVAWLSSSLLLLAGLATYT
jgi:hypothetical protein